MHQPLYRRVVADSLTTVWKHKHLWIFGFFAAVLGLGKVAESVFEVPAFGLGSAQTALEGTAGTGASRLASLSDYFAIAEYPGIAAVLFLVVGSAAAVALAWMSAASSAALIYAAHMIKKGGDAHFADGLHKGGTHAWAVLLAGILPRLLTFGFGILSAVNLWVLLTDPNILSAGFFIAGIIAFSILAAYAAMLGTFAAQYVVLENRHPGDAVRAGASLLRRHWVVALETAVLMFAMSIGIGVLGLAACAVLLVPVALLFLVAAAAEAASAMILLLVLSVAAIVLAIVVSGSLIATFRLTAWTLLFERLAEDTAVGLWHRFIGWARGKA